jgi:AraC-like DNA-binding protein
MVRAETVLDHVGVTIEDVACCHPRGEGEDELAPGHAVVFVRRGCFVHRAGGAQRLLDPSSFFFVNLGQEQRFDHPYDGGDDCTAVFLSPELVASVWGGEPSLPADVLHSSPGLDLQQRLLLAAARNRDEREVVAERAILLAARALEVSDPPRVRSGRPATERARSRLVEQAREALVADPRLTLPALARELAVSPHHLSRLFAAGTGHSVSRYRRRLRVRAALACLADGERDLARLAADLDFADHSHLCRAVREETGSTPSGLRAVLAERAPTRSASTELLQRSGWRLGRASEPAEHHGQDGGVSV